MPWDTAVGTPASGDQLLPRKCTLPKWSHPLNKSYYGSVQETTPDLRALLTLVFVWPRGTKPTPNLSLGPNFEPGAKFGTILKPKAQIWSQFGGPNSWAQIWDPNLGPGPKFGVRAIDVDVDVGATPPPPTPPPTSTPPPTPTPTPTPTRLRKTRLRKITTSGPGA